MPRQRCHRQRGRDPRGKRCLSNRHGMAEPNYRRYLGKPIRLVFGSDRSSSAARIGYAGNTSNVSNKENQQRKTEAMLVSATTRFLALAVVTGFVLNLSSAVAQSSNQGVQPGQWDMWNPNWMQRHIWGPGPMGPGMRHRMARHWAFMHRGIPAAYYGVRNPFSPNAKSMGEGRTLYQRNCVSCHGKTGMGDGEAANSLNPSPALLAT